MEKQYLNLQVWNGLEDDLTRRSIAVRAGCFTEIAESGDTLDLDGCYAIPGLIDAHIHLCLNPEVKDPADQTLPDEQTLKSEMRSRAEKMLRAGITTARDLGGGQYLELAIRDEIERGDTVGPRLICAGQPITSVGGHCCFWGGEAEDTTQALDVLRRQHEHNVDLIKVMVTGGNITPGSRPVDSQFEDDTVQKIVAAATANHYHVAAHCHGTDGIRQAAESGVTTVEHCSWVGDAGWGKAFDESVVATLAANNVWVSPTINSGWRRFKQPAFVDMIQANYERMKAAGVRLIASTDAGIPNIYHHDLPNALAVFAHFAKLSAAEVLRSATADCANAIGLAETTGVIAPGLSADFVVYEANPLEDLDVLNRPLMVVSRGVEYHP